MFKESLDYHNVTRKDRLIASFLVVNALTWFFTSLKMIENILNDISTSGTQNILILTAYYVSLTGSGIIGAKVSNKVDRVKFLNYWIAIGVIVSSLPLLFQNPTMEPMLIISILFGTSLGIGMPTCLAYFANSSSIDNRGLTSGIIFLVTNIASVALFSIGFSTLNLLVGSIVLVLWRACGLLVHFLKPMEQNSSENKVACSFRRVFRNKSFLFYFVAWLLFMLVDRSESPMLRFFESDQNYLYLAPIIGSFSALIAGILADRVGRKRIVITAFVTFGIAYAAIGIEPDLLLTRYFFLTIESISTGILVTTFVLLLWGDLAKWEAPEKYYAIGISPFFLTSILQLYLREYFMEVPNPRVFSLAAFFLFLAVIPLLYAPETLPEKKMELKRLRSFAEEAQKAKEKYIRKMENKN